MTDHWEGGYYAVIPAEVRYDKSLKPNAKLLYGELTSLCSRSGYCWATNEYFAELYSLSVGTVSRLISQLESQGYIHCEMAASARKVWVSPSNRSGIRPVRPSLFFATSRIRRLRSTPGSSR